MFFEAEDLDKDGYLTEEDFLRFYREKCQSSRTAVLENMNAFGYGEDLLPINKDSDCNND
jgi:hypothetical protein